MALAFTFNSIGIPLAATGLVYPVWAMVAMAASVATIFVNSIGGRPASLLFEAIRSVGRATRELEWTSFFGARSTRYELQEDVREPVGPVVPALPLYSSAAPGRRR